MSEEEQKGVGGEEKDVIILGKEQPKRVILVDLTEGDLDSETKEEKKRPFKTGIGFDLGTSNTVMGVWKNGNVDVVPMGNDKWSSETLPSIVSYKTEDEFVVGDKQLAIGFPKTTFREIQRVIGQRFINNPNLKKIVESLGITLEEDEATRVTYITAEVAGKTLKIHPEEVSAKVLSRAIFMYQFHGYDMPPVPERLPAVVTVPAYFTEAQEKATLDAFEMAGVKVLSTMPASTAAGIAYLSDEGELKSKEDEIILLVFDFGGGTLDISILRYNLNVFRTINLDGDTNLGGCNFDERLLDWAIRTIKERAPDKVKLPPAAKEKLRSACEQAKVDLSTYNGTETSIQFEHEGVDYTQYLQISRNKFDMLTRDLVTRAVNIMKRAIDDAVELVRKSTPGLVCTGEFRIDRVLLVGGTTLLPSIINAVTVHFRGSAGTKILEGLDRNLIVARGATIFANQILNKLDDDDPDKVSLVGVTAMDLGISVHGDTLSALIKKNSCHLALHRHTKGYTTVWDNQESVRVKVYQGRENAPIADCFYLGEFVVGNLPPGPAGSVDVDVTFELDKYTHHLKVTAGVSGVNIPMKSITIPCDDFRLPNVKKQLEEKRNLAHRAKQLQQSSEELKVEIKELLAHVWETAVVDSVKKEWDARMDNLELLFIATRNKTSTLSELHEAREEFEDLKFWFEQQPAFNHPAKRVKKD